MRRAFVIAMECEADCVRPHLKPDDKLYVSGIGKVNAAATTMKAILEHKPDLVINYGLAGGMKEEMEIGGLYEVSAAVEHDYDLSDLNHTPVGQKDERTSPFIPVSPLNLYKKEILLTGDSFADHALEMYDAGLRDMEGAAIADVCDKAGVKFVSFKCVCDVKGKGSMTGQYHETKERCLKTLCSALEAICSM